MTFDVGFSALVPSWCPYVETAADRNYDHLEVMRFRDFPDGVAYLFYVSYIKGHIICCVMADLNEAGTTYFTLPEMKKAYPPLFCKGKESGHISNNWEFGAWRDCFFVPARIRALL